MSTQAVTEIVRRGWEVVALVEQMAPGPGVALYARNEDQEVTSVYLLAGSTAHVQRAAEQAWQQLLAGVKEHDR